MSRTIAIVTGLIWAVTVVSAGQMASVPIALIQPLLMGALFAPGLIFAAMLARATIGHKSEQSKVIDQSVILDTQRQIVLALCVWPLSGLFIGAGLVFTLGIGFAIARLFYWLGAHRSPALAVFGATATLAPTLLVAVLVVFRLLLGS
ncbi:MAG: hypothetical protein AAGF53_00245 [Pseudomonadota bacterium]